MSEEERQQLLPVNSAIMLFNYKRIWEDVCLIKITHQTLICEKDFCGGIILLSVGVGVRVLIWGYVKE